jgi:hypothetical protein
MVILQEHNTLSFRVQSKLLMGIGTHLIDSNLSIWELFGSTINKPCTLKIDRIDIVGKENIEAQGMFNILQTLQH